MDPAGRSILLETCGTVEQAEQVVEERVVRGQLELAVIMVVEQTVLRRLPGGKEILL